MGKVKFVCPNCGQAKELPIREIERARADVCLCSKQCAQEWKTKLQRMIHKLTGRSDEQVRISS